MTATFSPTDWAVPALSTHVDTVHSHPNGEPLSATTAFQALGRIPGISQRDQRRVIPAAMRDVLGMLAHRPISAEDIADFLSNFDQSEWNMFIRTVRMGHAVLPEWFAGIPDFGPVAQTQPLVRTRPDFDAERVQVVLAARRLALCFPQVRTAAEMSAMRIGDVYCSLSDPGPPKMRGRRVVEGEPVCFGLQIWIRRKEVMVPAAISVADYPNRVADLAGLVSYSVNMYEGETLPTPLGRDETGKRRPLLFRGVDVSEFPLIASRRGSRVPTDERNVWGAEVDAILARVGTQG